MRCALAAVLALACCAQLARAEDAPATPAGKLSEAEAHHRAAVAAFAHGQYQKAIEQSTLADQLLPSADNSYNIARAYESLDDSSNALTWYRDYLQRFPRAPDRAHVLRKIAQHEKRLAEHGVQQVTIASSPTGARIWIDDVSLGTTPWSGALRAGSHALRVALPGYDDASPALVVSLEHAQKLEVALDAVPTRPLLTSHFASKPISRLPSSSAETDTDGLALAPVSGATRSSAAREHAHGHTLRTLGFVSLAGGALGLGGALGFEVARHGTEVDARAEKEQIKYQKELETMRSQQTAARVFAAVGGAAALGGIVLLAVSLGGGGSEHDDQNAAHAALTFACAPRSCGVTVRGRY